MTSYFLSPCGEKIDRKGDIEEKLQKYGVCILGAGTYFISGVIMPEGSTLCGFGDASRIVLLPEVEEGYAVTLSRRCTVKDLTLWGAEEAIERPAEVGSRHGIGFLGNARETKDNAQQPQECILSGLRIEFFSGGGITGNNTGYSADSSLCAANCRIHHCGAGINLAYFSEYHKFSNIISTRNLFGCINNGGNNVFSACAFDGNTLGFLIDNSEKQSPNNAHGSCVGCTFNHTDSNRGIGVKILGSQAGYVFSGCQFYYSKIHVEKSQGIQIANANFGKNIECTVKGGGVVQFSHCQFSNQPTFFIEENETVFLDRCHTKGGTPVLLETENE